MDRSSSAAAPPNEEDDWRSNFRPEARQITVNRIMEAMKKHFSGYDLSESDYKKIAVQLEDKIYYVAVDQNDYTHRIIRKVLSFETKTQSTFATSSPSNPPNPPVADLNPADPASIRMQTQAGNHGKPLSMPSVSQSPLRQSHLSQNLQNSSLSAAFQGSGGLPSVNNAQKHIQSRQQPPLIMSQHQTSQNQIMHQHQLLKQTARHSSLQQNQLQSSHQNSIEQSIPSLLEQQRSMSNIQQNQLHGQQNNVLGMRQLQQQQRLPGQLDSLVNMQHSQHMSNQQDKQPNFQGLQAQQQNQQPITLLQSQDQESLHQPSQQQLLSHIQSQPPQMMQRLQASAMMLQSQNTFEHQKQFIQPQRGIQEVSSFNQTGPAGVADWQEETYQKLKALKELYYPELKEIYQKNSMKLQMLPHAKQSEQVDKLRGFKKMLERYIALLQTSKNNIPEIMRNGLANFEKQLLNLLNSTRIRKAPSATRMHSSASSSLKPGSMSLSTHMTNQTFVGSLQSTSTITTPQHTSNNNGPQGSMNTSQSIADSLQHQQSKQQQSGVHQQQYPSDQRHIYYHQQQNLQISSLSTPQISQQPSQFEQQSLLASQSKVRTPLQPINTLFVVPSPSTPIALSPVPPEYGKVSVHASPHNTVNVGPQQTPQTQFLAVGTPGISTSPLLAELTSLDGSQGNFSNTLYGKLSTTEEPIDRLVNAVQSSTPKELMSSISHMRYILSMVDNIVDSEPGNRCRTDVSEDLVSTTNCHLQARDSITQEGSAPAKKLKRHINVMPLNALSSVGSVSDIFKQSYTMASDVESITTSSVERPGAKASPALMEEIKEINQSLIDTVVSISEDPNGGGEGTVIKFSFNAVSLSPSLKSQLPSALMSPIMPLRLLVPTNYPSCSPLLLDEIPAEASNELEDLSVKAQSRFNIALRCHAQPMSLGEMARTWDVCIRGAIDEDAQQSGGGSFSLRYGAWQSCV